MKARLVLYFFSFCILSLFSCSKSGLEPVTPIVTPVKYTVEISSDNNVTVVPSGKIQVVKGDSLKIAITAIKDGYKIDSVSVNGKFIPLTSTKKFATTNFADGDKIFFSAKKEVIIVVPNRTDTISSRAWDLKSSDVLENNIWVVDFVYPDSIYTAKNYFYSNGDFASIS
jgi:hypothetical protein